MALNLYFFLLLSHNIWKGNTSLPWNCLEFNIFDWKIVMKNYILERKSLRFIVKCLYATSILLDMMTCMENQTVLSTGWFHKIGFNKIEKRYRNRAKHWMNMQTVNGIHARRGVLGITRKTNIFLRNNKWKIANANTTNHRWFVNNVSTNSKKAIFHCMHKIAHIV